MARAPYFEILIHASSSNVRLDKVHSHAGSSNVRLTGFNLHAYEGFLLLGSYAAAATRLH